MVDMLVRDETSLPEIMTNETSTHASSRSSANLSRWGTQSFWVAVALAVACLTFGSVYVYHTPDKTVSQRIMIFVLLGVLPGLAAVLTGCAMFLSLKAAAVIYDPIARKLRLGYKSVAERLTPPMTAAGRTMIRWSHRSVVVLRLIRGEAARRSTSVMALGVAGAKACWREAGAVRRSVLRSARMAMRAITAALPAFRRFVALACRASGGVATGLSRACGCLARSVRRIATGATFPVRLLARALIRLLPTLA